MRLKLGTHFALVVLIVGGATVLLNPLLGVSYLAAAAAILLPLSGVWHVPPRFFYVVLFTAVAIWLTHLSRVPMLILLPETARFPRVVLLTSALGVRVVLQLALSGLCLLAGLVLGFKLFARSEAPPRENDPAERPFLVTASTIMALLCVLVLLGRVYFQLVLGLNTKFVPNPALGFLQRILPDELIYPIALLYLAKYRHRISPFETMVFAGCMVGLTLLVTLSGSRQAFAAIALALFIFFLAHRGNFRLGFVRGWLLGIAAAWLLMLTFAIAAPLRDYLDVRGELDQDAVGVMIEGARTAFEPTGLLLNASSVSKRVSGGLDGMLAVNLAQPQVVQDAFSPGRMMQVVLGKLVPRWATDEMVSGKALAVAYAGRSIEDRQASAVGMFAALQLTFGLSGSFVAVFVLGLNAALCFTLAERVRDPDLTFLLHFTGVQQIVIWILSGNLDIVIPGAIRSLAYIVVFGAVAVVMATAARAGTTAASSDDGAPLRAPAT